METRSLTQISMSKGNVGRHLAPASWTFKATTGNKELAVFLSSYFRKGFVVDFSSFVVSCRKQALSALLIIRFNPQATADVADSVFKEIHTFSSSEQPMCAIKQRDQALVSEFEDDQGFLGQG